MKNLLVLIFLLGFGMSHAQDIFKSFEKSDFQKIAMQLADPVELYINDVTKMTSKKEAIQDIKAFFKEVKPTACKQIHKGSSKRKGSNYKVAKLITEKGDYRLFLYIENRKIQELRIDKDN